MTVETSDCKMPFLIIRRLPFRTLDGFRITLGETRPAEQKHKILILLLVVDEVAEIVRRKFCDTEQETTAE